MINNSGKSNLVLALYPNSNGFGFVYMEDARKLLDFGSVRINPINNIKIIGRIKHSILYLRPAIVILQDPNGKCSRTGERVINLIEKITSLSEEMDLKVMKLSRDQIRDVFEQFGGSTKYEISQILITYFKELEAKLPKKRKLWTSEDRNMAIFDALSLALTWFYIHG